MKQYTTEWAKEYLKEHEEIIAIAQDDNGLVCEFYGDVELDKKYNAWYIIGDENWFMIEEMLEHPDGWENSLVTRDDL